MVSVIKKYASLFMIIAAVMGFLFPQLSNKVLGLLPVVLFLLMFVTLIGMKQTLLLKSLLTRQVWLYAVGHSVLLSILICGIASIIGVNSELLIAISAVTATGSLFATPAIVRSLGLEHLEAMAMTIASTFMMPLVLYINLSLFQDHGFTLDLSSYLLRLVIFIAGPLILAAIVVKLVKQDTITALHGKLSAISILLVFAFPFGLMGSFSDTVKFSPQNGLKLFVCALVLTFACYCLALLMFASRGKKQAFICAIASGNRNLLLTYVVAGPYLGDAFLPLVGALQLPIYALPWITQKLIHSPNFMKVFHQDSSTQDNSLQKKSE